MIKVVSEFEDTFYLLIRKLERCCFCRDNSSYWSPETDVPVCLRCSKVFNVEDIPSRTDWQKKEKLIEESKS